MSHKSDIGPDLEAKVCATSGICVGSEGRWTWTYVQCFIHDEVETSVTPLSFLINTPPHYSYLIIHTLGYILPPTATLYHFAPPLRLEDSLLRTKFHGIKNPTSFPAEISRQTGVLCKYFRALW